MVIIMKETWSVELEANSWSDDLFNGTFDECVDYCKNNDYKIDGITGRLAKVLLDGNCVSEVLEICEEL